MVGHWTEQKENSLYKVGCWYIMLLLMFHTVPGIRNEHAAENSLATWSIENSADVSAKCEPHSLHCTGVYFS